MTTEIKMSHDQLIVTDETGVITGRHHSQLSYWGFRYDPVSKSFLGSPDNLHLTLDKLLAYFTRSQIPCSLAQEVATSRAELSGFKEELQKAIHQGSAVKSGDVTTHRPGEFVRFLGTNIPRRLKEH